jgi:uncharacterized protein (TIGR02246 family)
VVRGALEVTTIQPVADHGLITALIDEQMRAWNEGDAPAFSDAFMDDGCFVNVLGSLSYGRGPFEAQHAKIFATIYRGSTIKLPIRRVQFLRSDVALVDIDAELDNCAGLPPGLNAQPDGIVRTRLQEVLVKESGRWRVASFHNVEIKPDVSPGS